MAYQINKTSGALLVNLADGQIDVATTDITLIGKNYTGFGESINENFVKMLENFANGTAPSNPTEGQLWYDTTDSIDQLKIYDGTNWVAAGGLKKNASEPDSTNSVKGDLWVNTSTSQLYLYTGSGWLLVGPDFSNGNTTGAKSVEIVDTTDTTRTVVVVYIENIPVSIIKKVLTGIE